jgi:hypothetical protein
MWGHAFRKIMEATACGCRVITDLPTDEVLPHIDDNLIRVHPSISPSEMTEIVREECEHYDPEFQCHLAAEACTYYDYRAVGLKLANDIEDLRQRYNNPPSNKGIADV